MRVIRVYKMSGKEVIKIFIEMEDRYFNEYGYLNDLGINFLKGKDYIFVPNFTFEF